MKFSIIFFAAIVMALVLSSVDGAPYNNLYKRHKDHHGHTGHHTGTAKTTKAKTTKTTKAETTKAKTSHHSKTGYYTSTSTSMSTKTKATSMSTATATDVPTPKGKVCTVAHSGGDDSNNINAAFQACLNGGSVVFEKGTTYQLNKPLEIDHLDGVNVYIYGNILYTYPMKGSSDLKWLFLQGNNIKVFGSNDPNWGTIMGQGQKYWDAGKLGNPKMLGLKSNGGGIYGLKLVDAPSQFISITNCNNFEIMNVKITAVSTNPDKHPAKNTDAFDVSHSTNVTISGAYVMNGDDCLAINGGVQLLHFTDSFCGGSSHGASVGSLGKNGQEDDVSDIYIKNIHLKDATYAARFKSWPGGKGTATNLNWENIFCDGCDMPVFVTEEYCDHEVGCKSGGTSIKINGASFTNFTGTTSGKYGNQIVNITCSAGTPCENLSLSNINVAVPGGLKPVLSCLNVPSGLIGCKS